MIPVIVRWVASSGAQGARSYLFRRRSLLCQPSTPDNNLAKSIATITMADDSNPSPMDIDDSSTQWQPTDMKTVHEPVPQESVDDENTAAPSEHTADSPSGSNRRVRFSEDSMREFLDHSSDMADNTEPPRASSSDPHTAEVNFFADTGAPQPSAIESSTANDGADSAEVAKGEATFVARYGKNASQSLSKSAPKSDNVDNNQNSSKSNSENQNSSKSKTDPDPESDYIGTVNVAELRVICNTIFEHGNEEDKALAAHISKEYLTPENLKYIAVNMSTQEDYEKLYQAYQRAKKLSMGAVAYYPFRGKGKGKNVFLPKPTSAKKGWKGRFCSSKFNF